MRLAHVVWESAKPEKGNQMSNFCLRHAGLVSHMRTVSMQTALIIMSVNPKTECICSSINTPSQDTVPLLVMALRKWPKVAVGLRIIEMAFSVQMANDCPLHIS